MQKMTTKDLLEKYPDTFVNYLESKYRAKCSAWLISDIIYLIFKEKLIIRKVKPYRMYSIRLTAAESYLFLSLMGSLRFWTALSYTC